MIQTLPIGATPEEVREKINALIEAQNRADTAAEASALIEGTGIKLTRTENGTRIDISGLTATGTCVEGGMEIVINGAG
jgi:hypothetical protein